MRTYLTEKTKLHDEGIMSTVSVTLQSNVNVCPLKNGNVSLGLREGETSIVHELTPDGVRHLIGLLAQAV